MWVVHVVQTLCLAAADVLWMSAVHGMRRVGGVCEIGMSLAQAERGVE